MMNTNLITKDIILWTEYRGMRITSVVVFEVPKHVKGKALAAYFMQFRQILSFSSDHKVGEWRFDVMLCRQPFDSIPSMLDIDQRMLPIIVTDRKPTCWKCANLAIWPLCAQKSMPRTANRCRTGVPLIPQMCPQQSPLSLLPPCPQ